MEKGTESMEMEQMLNGFGFVLFLFFKRQFLCLI